jgi:hypothetical protein
MKKYFKINYSLPIPKVDGRSEVKENNDKITRVTLGKPSIPTERITNQHEGIHIIDHAGSSGDSDGGFLLKRFKR